MWADTLFYIFEFSEGQQITTIFLTPISSKNEIDDIRPKVQVVCDVLVFLLFVQNIKND